MSEKWFDFLPDQFIKPISANMNKKMIEIKFEDGKTLRFVKRGLTQFLHSIGLKKCDIHKYKPEDILNKWYDIGLNTVLSAFKDGEKYIVYRVTSNEYIPIPHRILFKHVDMLIKKAGIKTSYTIQKYYTKTSAKWLLYSAPLEYARPNDVLNVYLQVSNANTGNDSIKVFGYGEILQCKNGLILTRGARVKIMHVKTIQGILERVTRAIQIVVKKLIEEKEIYVTSIVKLQNITLTKEELNEWVNKLTDSLPNKYKYQFAYFFDKNLKIFGNNMQTLFQTITALTPRVKNYTLHKQLNKYAHEILAMVR